MICVDELRAAYLASGLWRQRKRFADCLADPVLRGQLIRHAAAIRTLMARRGQRAPKQEELAL